MEEQPGQPIRPTPGEGISPTPSGSVPPSPTPPPTSSSPPGPPPKKSGIVKWILIIIIVLLVIGITAASVWYFVIKKTTEVAETVEETEAPVSTEEQTPTNEPSAEPSAEPTTPSEKWEGKIREALSNGKVEMTINSISFEDKIISTTEAGDLEAETGHTYVVVDITFSNISDESYTVYSGEDFYIKDSYGKNYKDVEYGEPVERCLGLWPEISSGDTLRGKIAILISEDASKEELDLIYDSYFDDELPYLVIDLSS